MFGWDFVGGLTILEVSPLGASEIEDVPESTETALESKDDLDSTATDFESDDNPEFAATTEDSTVLEADSLPFLEDLSGITSPVGVVMFVSFSSKDSSRIFKSSGVRSSYYSNK